MLKTNLLKAAGASEKRYVDDVFSAWLYDGNGSTQTINNGIDLAGEGGLVWIKARSATTNNWLLDTSRGVNVMYSDSTMAEADASTGFTSFDAAGFTLPGTNSATNASSGIYASWTFRNATKFFTHLTVSHTNGVATNISLSSLGEVGMVTAKIANTTGDWITWHRSLTAGNNLRLNTTAAETTTDAWLSVSGTTATLSSAAPTGTYVVYAWAHDTSVEGLIRCGSYTTDGSGNATVDFGWEPQFFIRKQTSTTGPWLVRDSLRGGRSEFGSLSANTINAEVFSTTGQDIFESTGFRAEGTFASTTFIYLAIRIPDKPPTSGTEVFQPVVYSGTNTDNRLVNTGIKTDMAWFRMRTGSSTGYEGFVVGDRLRSQSYLKTGAVIAEELALDGLDQQLVSATEYGTAFSSMTGVWVGNTTGIDVTSCNINANTTANNHIALAFKRAPGFFDIVTYTGTGVARTVPHQLGVPPDLMLVKQRNAPDAWYVYAGDPTDYLVLNSTAATADLDTVWDDTAPTASVFTVGTNLDINQSANTYAAYLFASLPGISKVGSYTGNDSSQTINCGFSTGARFFLVKATSTTGNWWVFDSARGIVSSFDPALALNSTAAEVTSADAVDNDPSGVIVNQEATCSINASGVSYIFLAIS